MQTGAGGVGGMGGVGGSGGEGGGGVQAAHAAHGMHTVQGVQGMRPPPSQAVATASPFLDLAVTASGPAAGTGAVALGAGAASQDDSGLAKRTTTSASL